MTQKVVLIGGGHAHIEVVRRWREQPPQSASLTLMDPNSRPIYSGMVPGYIAEQYDRANLEIDLENLCRRAGARFDRSRVAAIDAKRHCVIREDGSQLGYDIASIDIGSSVAGKEVPGVAEYAIPTRPIANFLTRVDELMKTSHPSDRACAPVHVVGGGAGGVEVAFCLQERLRRGETPDARVELVIGSSQLLAGGAASAVAASEKHAAACGIRVHRGSRVARLGEHFLVLESGRKLTSRAVIWVTGPAAHPFAAASDLPTDQNGFLQVDSTLRVEGYSDLFAVGDCASLAGMKKAGVYAVRSGPMVDANIRARLHGTPLRTYKPQRGFLSLLNLGNGEAIGTKWGLSYKGRRVMWLKDRIDRSFVEKYQ